MSIMHAQSVIASSGVGIDRYSLDLDGSTEQLANLTNQAIGISSAWTIAVWYKPILPSGRFDCIFEIKSTVSALANAIRLHMDDGDLRVRCYDFSSNLIKEWVTKAAFAYFNTGVWSHVVAGWQNTGSLTLYFEGSPIDAGDITKSTDTTGTMTATNRSIAVGGETSLANTARAFIHSTAIYDAKLSDANVAAMWNSGAGSKLDLRFNKGNYDSSGNLVHYYRHGLDPSNIGRDWAGSIDIGDDAVSVTSADIAADAP